MDNEFTVNGLPLPKLLIELLQAGQWQHPGHDVMRKVIPFLDDRVIFLKSVEHMRLESSSLFKEYDLIPAEFFHEERGTRQTVPLELPWLDVEKAFFVAVNEEIGADVAIALDYRTSEVDPRVVASSWTNKGQFWQEVTPTFSEFVERIGLK